MKKSLFIVLGIIPWDCGLFRACRMRAWKMRTPKLCALCARVENRISWSADIIIMRALCAHGKIDFPGVLIQQKCWHHHADVSKEPQYKLCTIQYRKIILGRAYMISSTSCRSVYKTYQNSVLIQHNTKNHFLDNSSHNFYFSTKLKQTLQLLFHQFWLQILVGWPPSIFLCVVSGEFPLYLHWLFDWT